MCLWKILWWRMDFRKARLKLEIQVIGSLRIQARNTDDQNGKECMGESK